MMLLFTSRDWMTSRSMKKEKTKKKESTLIISMRVFSIGYTC